MYDRVTHVTAWGPPVLSRDAGETHFLRAIHRRNGIWLLRFDDRDYQVEHGTGIVTGARRAGEHPGMRSLQLRGPVLAMHWHARGRLVLHASAVRGPRGVYALAGESGSGKSTLAAFAAADGAEVWADDIVPVDLGDAPRAHRASPRLRLSPAVWELAREAPGWEGHRVRCMPDGRLQTGACRAAERTAPLAAVLLVERHQDPDTRVEPVEGAARLADLAPHLYLRALISRSDDPEDATTLLSLAASVPVHRLSVPERLEAARPWWRKATEALG